MRRVLTWKTVCLVVDAPEDLLSAASRLLGLSMETAAIADEKQPDVTVTRRAEGFLLECRVEICTAPCRDDAVMKLVALLSFFFLDRSEATILHAGAFACDAGAVLFCGEPYAGKSSLALAAWRRGHALLGDDWIALNSGGTVSAFPKPLKTRASSCRLPDALAPLLPPGDHLLALLGDEIRIAFGRALPRMVGYDTELEVAGLFLLERHGAPTKVEPAPRELALRAILTQTMPTRAKRLGAVPLLERLRRQGRVYRLNVGEDDVERAVDEMIETLRGVP